jgi:hypothetical protein
MRDGRRPRGATNDIDPLIDTSPDNQDRVRRTPVLGCCGSKDTLRDRDKVDRAFLAQLLAARGGSID